MIVDDAADATPVALSPLESAISRDAVNALILEQVCLSSLLWGI